jgi:hypothetical protein
MVDHIGDYLEQVPVMYQQGLFAQSAAKKHKLGTIRELDDGRKFIYCLNTAAQIAAGICVSKAVTPQDCTVAAADVAAVGDRKVTVTLTGTPTLNQYQDGWLLIKAGAGIGEMYKIRGNTVDDTPASGHVTLYLYDSIKTLWVLGNTTIAIHVTPYHEVLINPAVANGDATTGERILGITTRIVAASKYFWAQTWGLAAAMLDIDAAAGTEADERVLVPGTTEGRLLLSAAGAENDQQRYGHPLETADLTDAEANLVMLEVS